MKYPVYIILKHSLLFEDVSSFLKKNRKRRKLYIKFLYLNKLLNRTEDQQLKHLLIKTLFELRLKIDAIEDIKPELDIHNLINQYIISKANLKALNRYNVSTIEELYYSNHFKISIQLLKVEVWTKIHNYKIWKECNKLLQQYFILKKSTSVEIPKEPDENDKEDLQESKEIPQEPQEESKEEPQEETQEEPQEETQEESKEEPQEETQEEPQEQSKEPQEEPKEESQEEMKEELKEETQEETQEQSKEPQEEPKEEPKEEPQEETQEQSKEPQEEPKEEPKEETQEELKEEPKEELKEELKEESKELKEDVTEETQEESKEELKEIEEIQYKMYIENLSKLGCVLYKFKEKNDIL